MKICGIYKITSPTNCIYIGQSVNIDGRRRYYKALLCKDQPRLYNSILKHGWVNHSFEILKECTPEELNNLEQFYIKVFNTCNSKKGLNLTMGGLGRGIVSEETRLKLSKALTGNPAWNKGKPHSETVRKNISLALRSSEKFKAAQKNPEIIEKKRQSSLGRKHTQETKDILSIKLKGRVFSDETKNKMSIGSTGIRHTPETIEKIIKSTSGSNNHFYGKKHSAETILKISKNRRRINLNS